MYIAEILHRTYYLKRGTMIKSDKIKALEAEFKAARIEGEKKLQESKNSNEFMEAYKGYSSKMLSYELRLQALGVEL